MPRRARLQCEGRHVHALNRRVDRQPLLHAPDDYDCLASILAWAQRAVGMEITAWCLMPNHWHLILRPDSSPQLTEFMHRVQTTHAIQVRRDSATRGQGCVYGSRFKGFLIPPDRLLRSVVYVERNPVKAGLAKRAEEWPASSAGASGDGIRRPSVVRLPAELERHRRALLRQPLPEEFERAFQQACCTGDFCSDHERARIEAVAVNALRRLDGTRARLRAG